jgi:hypothetical protein
MRYLQASLVLYDVSTLYFETDAADGLRGSGFSKEESSRVVDGVSYMITRQPSPEP